MANQMLKYVLLLVGMVAVMAVGMIVLFRFRGY